MKSTYKKLGAIALVVVMLLALSVPAFADDSTKLTLSGSGTSYTATFNKGLKLDDSGYTGTLYAPNVTYTYSVGTATTVHGSSTAVAPTVTASNVSFNNADTAADGAVVTKTGTFTINTASATAGVFRYEITENSADRVNNGVTRESTYVATRYLEVYVNKDKEVTAVQLVKETTAGDPPVTTRTKTTGWTDSTGIGGDDLDVYETVDVTVKKVISGDLADRGHAFPFTFPVSFSNGSKVIFNDTAYDAASATATNLKASLSNDQTTVVYGVPKNATATLTITETNNTLDTYEVTTTNLATNLTSVSTAKDATAGGVTNDVTADITVQFTNNLPTISPTGVVLRVAPYALMLGIGLFLVLFTRRRKAEEEA